ncbi:MAG: hypothetical protein IJ217_06320 [Clostridia bacterium]|nr:hypothetical protein [Clostridia bacterium]
MKKLFLLVALAGLALGLFIGIRSSVLENKEEEAEEVIVDTSYQDELNLPLIEVDTLNPILTKNKQVADTLKLVYEPLFDFDSLNRLTPSLAIEWMERDDTTWIIRLRENVSWHSGKSFSADDVIFTINSIKGNSASVYYENVKNIAEISKLEDNSISLLLNEKDSLLPYKLTFPIVPEYYFRDGLSDKEKTSRPVGTGPYQYFATSEDGARMTLKYNASWWNHTSSKLNTIYLYQYQTYGEAIKAFKSSEIDVITTSMISWEKKFGIIGINSYRYENEKFDVLIPNCNRLALSDSSVRRAILYAINRDNIIDEVYLENASKQDMMLHSYSWAFHKDLEVEYSQEKAKQLLTNSLWQQRSGVWSKTINGSNVSLRLNLMVCKDSEEKVEAALKIKENLENIGMKITIVQVDSNTFQKNMASHNFDLALGTLTSKNEFDLMELLQENNFANFNSAAMAEEFAQLYLSNLNLENAFYDFQAKYETEMPYIGLYFRTNVLLTNKAVKGNMTPTAWNPYYQIWQWSK